MFINPCDSLNMLYPDATATISLQGLMLFWIDRKRRCQISILRCEDHDLTMDIFQVPRTSTAKSSAISPMNHNISLNKDVIISAEKAKDTKEPKTGILSYKDFSSTFNRTDRSPVPGNINDFRWIINLEGEEFHNRKLEFIQSGRTSAKVRKNIKNLTPMITVDDGTVYTQAISSEMLLRRDEEGQIKMFGRVAYRIGIDIRSEKVFINNKNGKKLPLVYKPDILHVIQISNMCSLEPKPENPESTAGRSDFDLFYDVVRDPIINHRRYDLQGCVNPRTPDNPGQDGYPDICIGGYMGESGHFTG